MKDPDPNAPTPRSPAGRFMTTHWSVVLAAKSATSPRRTEALSSLCETYWFPLYAFLRRNGHDTAQAEDFAQAFFAQLLDKDYLRHVEPEKGKFRTFLLTALKHFVSKQRKYDRALKRGGGKAILSLDVEDADGLPSSARQFAMASLRVTPPPFFITMDEELLTFRPVLEARYGLRILSFPEAVLLLRETDGPPN